LFLAIGSQIHFSTIFTIGNKEVYTQGSSKGSLSLFSAYLNVATTEPSIVSSFPIPSYNIGYNECLPILKDEVLS
jgi:hypothetical protein